MKLLYHKTAGLLSSEAWGIDFLVSLHCFHSCKQIPTLLWFLCLCNRSSKVNYLLRSFGNGLGCGWWEVHWIRLLNICTFYSSKSTALWNSSPHLSHDTIGLLVWTPYTPLFLEYTTGCRKGCIVQALHFRKSFLHAWLCVYVQNSINGQIHPLCFTHFQILDIIGKTI